MQTGVTAPNIIVRESQDPEITANIYANDCEAFLWDVLGIRHFYPKVREYCEAVQTKRKVVIRGSYGTRKTFLTAGITIWRTYRKVNAKVVTTAPRERQVRELLWAEINNLWNNAKMRLGGRCNATSIYPNPDYPMWFATGMTANQSNESAMQGYHGEEVTFIGDESTGLRPSTFDIADRICVGTNDRQIFLGNAIDPLSHFAGLFKDPTFAKIVITAFDTPNVMHRQTIIPGMVTWEWVIDKARKWGKNSQLYKSRVLAQFPTGQDQAMIPLHFIEQAMARWDALIEAERSRNLALSDEQAAELIAARIDGVQALGADFAGGGKDRSIFARRKAWFHYPLEEVTGNTQSLAGQLAIEHSRGYELAGDAIAIGRGVTDPLDDAGIPIVKVVGSERSDKVDPITGYGYANKRTELYADMRGKLDPDNPDPHALPRDDDLLEELATPTYSVLVGGRIQMEPKEKLKARLGRSPDKADATVNSLAVESVAPAAIQPKPQDGSQAVRRHEYERRSGEPLQRRRRW